MTPTTAPPTTTRPTPAAAWRPTNADIRAYAIDTGVCVRPVLRRLTDRDTGDTTTVAIRCGSTREHVCPPCATRARALRATQCREGWHLEVDPLDTNDAQNDSDEPADDLEPTDEPEPEQTSRRVRSTRRRDDAPDLPRVPQEHRSIGRTYTGRDGRTYRPSMFVTLTLPSYGKVTGGVPVDPNTYDYARAARDAIAFSALFDRWVQNLRRCAGYKVQYFAAIEAQHRLAAHAHIAIRGAIPRTVLRQVTRATYLSQWWPPHDEHAVVYTDPDSMPVWTGPETGYVDPATGQPLRTWDQALDDLDADPHAGPSHVARFGRQLDIQGLTAPSTQADRAIRYLTKYLTKTIAATHTPTDPHTGHVTEDPATCAHIDRLHQHTRWLPCGPTCANWLRWGIQPKNPGPGLAPGMCPGRAHDRENLGLGGRRVLASRHWSGKTLAEHAADRASVVRQTLLAAGIEAPEADRCAADVLDEDGQPRFVWQDIHPTEADYPGAILAAAHERHRWRHQYEHAQRLLEHTHDPTGSNTTGRERDGPPDQPNPTTTPPVNPHTQTCGQPFSKPRRETLPSWPPRKEER